MNDYVTRPELQTFEGILQRIERKLGEVDAKLGEVDAKLGEVDGKLGAVNAKLGAVDAKLGEVDAKLGEVDAKLGEVDERTRRQGVLHERLESKVDAVIEALGTKASKSDVEHLRAEIVPRLDLLESAVRARP